MLFSSKSKHTTKQQTNRVCGRYITMMIFRLQSGRPKTNNKDVTMVVSTPAKVCVLHK